MSTSKQEEEEEEDEDFYSAQAMNEVDAAKRSGEREVLEPFQQSTAINIQN
jgi:hypothetical protein